MTDIKDTVSMVTWVGRCQYNSKSFLWVRMFAGDTPLGTRWLWPYCCSHYHEAEAVAVTALKRSEKHINNHWII